MSSAKNIKIGIGYDIHRLEKGRPLILGGVLIPHTKGIVAHSDGDVLIHALSDALLGALALPNIGYYFPDTDPKNQNLNSFHILQFVLSQLRDRDYFVNNIDAVIIAQEPKLLPFIPKMRKNIAQQADISLEDIGLKATTHEKLGEIGKGDAIAVLANVLISR